MFLIIGQMHSQQQLDFRVQNIKSLKQEKKQKHIWITVIFGLKKLPRIVEMVILLLLQMESTVYKGLHRVTV